MHPTVWTHYLFPISAIKIDVVIDNQATNVTKTMWCSGQTVLRAKLHAAANKVFSLSDTYQSCSTQERDVFAMTQAPLAQPDNMRHKLTIIRKGNRSHDKKKKKKKKAKVWSPLRTQAARDVQWMLWCDSYNWPDSLLLQSQKFSYA